MPHYNLDRLRQLLAQLEPTELFLWGYDDATLLPHYRRLQADTPPSQFAAWLLNDRATHAPILAKAKRHQPKLYARFAPYETPITNPFSLTGRIRQATQFFGRARQVREITQELKNGNNVALIGNMGLGKSSLLYYLYLTRHDWLPKVTVHYVDLQVVLDEADFCHEILQLLGRPGDNLRALRDAIRQAEPLVLLFDEMERLAESDFNARLHGMLRSLGQSEHFSMVIALSHPIEQVFPPGKAGGASDFYNIFQEFQLPPFTDWEARQFIAHRLHDSGLSFSPAEIDHLMEQSGGHPATLIGLARHLFAGLVDL